MKAAEQQCLKCEYIALNYVEAFNRRKLKKTKKLRFDQPLSNQIKVGGVKMSAFELN